MAVAVGGMVERGGHGDSVYVMKPQCEVHPIQSELVGHIVTVVGRIATLLHPQGFRTDPFDTHRLVLAISSLPVGEKDGYC